MYDAIVLAGGSARRMDGADKPGLRVGAATLLERVVAAVGSAGRIVVVGPQRAGLPTVTWCREQPAGAGPLAALAAGLEHVDAATVVVLAADLPWIGPAVPRLLAGLAGAGPAEVAVLEIDGRRNYLAAAWRRAALAAALGEIAQPAGVAVRRLFASVVSVAVRDEDGWGRDCDTWDDLAVTRAMLAEQERA